MADTFLVSVGLAPVALRTPDTAQENQVLTNEGNYTALLASAASYVITASGSTAAVVPGAPFTPGSQLRLIKNGTVLYAGTTTLGIAVTSPAVPASGTAATNSTGADVAVTLAGGTVTAVAVNGVTILSGTNVTGSVIAVPNGGTITLTYSSAPTWTWNSGERTTIGLSAGVQAT